MIKNYLKIAWRNLKKDKIFSLLNITGLSIAFGAAILLSMAAFFDLSYDNFHKNIDTTYQVYATDQTAKGTEVSTSNGIPFADALKTEVPGVAKISRYLEEDVLVTYGNKELNMNATYVDNDFFSIFTFPAKKGNLKDVLKDKSTVVITQKNAEILFGKEDAIGKIITLMINGKEHPFTVGTVLKNIVAQSSIDFDIALRFENHSEYEKLKDQWNSRNHEIYLQLQSGISAKQFEKSTITFNELHFKKDIEDNKRDGAIANANGLYKELHLLPFKDVHFTSFGKGLANTSRTYPYLILGIAFLILFIACVNFINMSIAKSAQRLKEIGMRKTLGAQKTQLFFQFWSESLVVFFASMAIGVGFSKLFMNDFKSLFRTQVSFSNITPTVLFGFLVAMLLITLLVGGYPAIVMSKLKTIQALQGKLEKSGKNRVRDLLIILQFSIAIILISSTLILRSQLNYMRTKDLGFNKKQVIAFPLNGKKNSYQVVQLLRDALQSNPNILSVTAADNILGLGKDGNGFSSVLGFDYKGRGVKTNMLVVDYDYIKTLDIPLIKGRSFNREYATDSLSVVINEAMAKELGEKDPLTAQLMINDSVPHAVIGVIKDYNFQQLNKKIEPITLFMNTDWNVYYAYVKIAPTNIAQSFAAIKNVWNTLEPNAEFMGSFLDENVDRTFRREKIMTKMITSGSIIAILLSCIGLFAISLLVVAQRTKEIGIRKVVGASIASITFILTKDFLKLILLAFLIASPIAWWLMSKWLQEYAYKIDLSIWFFVGAGALAILIALLTISTKTIKAAIQNPVKSLRTE